MNKEADFRVALQSPSNSSTGRGDGIWECNCLLQKRDQAMGPLSVF